MPEIQYPTNPNSDTAFVVQDNGTKNRALMVAPQDISTLELPSNANSTKGYVTVDGKKQRVILTADISGNGGDQHNLGWYADLAALQTAHPTGEDGDFAILGSTDTVWVWDSDTSAWKDTDTKGQVTSVNGQTGDVTLTIPDAVQYSTMPTASADNLGDIVQFTGTTDANYTNGYFYKCVSDGQEPATYSWSQVDVQPAGATYTAGTGINIDANNEISVAAPTLTNDATGSGSVGILSSTVSSINSTVCGNMALSSGNNSTAIGYNSSGNTNAVAIGYMADTKQYGVSVGVFAGDHTNCGTRSIYVGYLSGGNSTGTDAIGIGYRAKATAIHAIQLGNQSSSNDTTNSDPNTFKVANENGNFELMNANGNLPADRLASTTGLADGNYRLRLVMASGVPTLEWVAE